MPASPRRAFPAAAQLWRRGLSTKAFALDIWSFNLRTEFQEEADGRNSWTHRREGVAELIRTRRPALVCAQEATEPMLDFLASRLGDCGYTWLAHSRTPGIQDETAGFLFDQGRLDVQDHAVEWLAPAGSLPGSLGWDAACPRTFETAEFAVRGEGARTGCLRVLNTHLDHVGVEARRRSAELLAAAVALGAAKRPGCAHLLCGDFNSPKVGSGHVAEVYSILLKSRESSDLGGPGLRDAARAAQVRKLTTSTIHKFEGVDFSAARGDGTVEFKAAPDAAADFPDYRHIDWVLWRDSASGLCLKPLRFEVITERLASGRYPSDHFPVSATFEASQQTR